MRPKSENLFKKFIYSRPAFIIGLLILFFLIYSAVGMAEKKRETRINKELVEAELIKLEKQQTSLKANIENLNTEEGKESAIREKFRVVKEGEGLVVIVDSPTQPEKPEGNKFTDFFKRIFGGKKEN